MADPSKDKAGDSSVDKLYEIFSKMFEQQQQLRVVPEGIKYALEPNPVKLAGPGNYISWARHAQLILSSHGYDDLLSADEGKQLSDTSAKQVNDRVLVWLLGSMEPPIREQVETMTTVSEVWAALEKQFAGRSNKMQGNRIMHELTNLKQGAKSVTEYAGETKRLYRELHYYHPFEPVDKQDLAIHHTWFEPFVSKLFLDGLNEEFDLRRQLIFSKTEWLSLDDVISSVIEEETRLAQPENGLKYTDARAALSMQARRAPKFVGKSDKNKLFCNHCKRTGHIKDACFELHGFPTWWEKGKSRPGGVHGANKKQANLTTSKGELPMVDVRALEDFTSKLRLSEGSSTSQDSSKAESSFYINSHQGASDRETVGDWDRA
uniref:Retrotransposon gag domain-containing protein n=1 Tax=Triticum urartu TaxID=4572 RepID=A0A8R7R7E7_TRIUA